jgi:hypothetical protein
MHNSDEVDKDMLLTKHYCNKYCLVCIPCQDAGAGMAKTKKSYTRRTQGLKAWVEHGSPSSSSQRQWGLQQP